MRLLHAGLPDGLGRALAAQPESLRGRDPRGARQQHLPLHGLREDHRGGEARGRARRRWAHAMNEIVPARNIGDYVPMVDGPEKVSGRAKYTADLIAPGMLAGRIYRSPYAHAEIIKVDVSEAEKLPGVKAIVTGAECDRTFGVLPIARSQRALAPDAATLHERKPRNIERDVLFELGRVEQGFAGADLVREGTYNCAEV